MNEKVVELLKRSDKALNIYEIQDELGIKEVNDIKELQKVLDRLEKNATIYHSNKDRYMMLEDSHLQRGIMRANKKGFGFVDVDNSETDVFIKEENMNGALHDDVVLIELTSKKGINRPEGRVLKIVDRKKDTYVGEINFKKNKGIVSLDDNKLRIKVNIPADKTMNAVDGHKVVVKLGKRIDNHTFEGEVTEIIGHKNDPGIDILSIVKKYNIETVLPDDIKEELKTFPNEVTEEEIKGRRDLRNEVIFTIDGDDTKDIDDAISIKRKNNGNYILGVHIADVSYYVKEGSPLDNDAMERGTSVYLVDRVIPMLPHELSNGICSLNPNVDRLTISCVMEFNAQGKQVDYEIFESVIRSNIQMTYKKVNQILENNEVPEGYEKFVKDLKLMHELADILRKEKENRGYIDFKVDEAKILVDEACVPYEVTLRNRGIGERLIEDFMIAANECVATHIYFMNLPFIYRIHEQPKEERIRDFLSFIGTLGYKANGNLKENTPKNIQKLIKMLEDKKEFKILSNLLLRSMQKAEYRETNLGHFGLASKCYTHFTSPIRRYPDTTVHRLLRTYLFNNKLDDGTIRHWEDKLPFIAEHSSAKERASINCEREVEDMKMAEYMEKHIGEEFEGMISSVMSFGMFVELDNLIEGLVSVKDMKGFFDYSEERMSLTNEKSKEKYTIGDRVVVKVIRASKEEKTIDFEIVKKV